MISEMDTSTLLVQAAAESIENWVFLEATQVHSRMQGRAASGASDQPQEEMETVFPITAGISLGQAGHLRLAVEEPFLRRLAGILYRLEAKDVSHEMEMDLLLELLNMIAGRYISLLAGKGKVVSLGLPGKENLKDARDVLLKGTHMNVEEAGRMILYWDG
ncbi:MAG: hypothetical protein JNM63_16300 [Spirochaetia bacterium]|nr:hypothetical protein [Spirochaetia bacterium]